MRRRTEPRLQQHIGRVFETICREHATRLVREGALPADMIIGRWWREETAEVDVLGLMGDRTALPGECRWQTASLNSRDLAELQRKLAYVPDPADEVSFLFWTRTGVVAPGFGAGVFSAEDVVGHRTGC